MDADSCLIFRGSGNVLTRLTDLRNTELAVKPRSHSWWVIRRPLLGNISVAETSSSPKPSHIRQHKPQNTPLPISVWIYE